MLPTLTRALPDLCQILEQNPRELVADVCDRLGARPDLGSMRRFCAEQLEPQIARLAEALRAAASGSWAECERLFADAGRWVAGRPEPLRSWCEGAALCSGSLSRRLVATHAGDAARLMAALEALQLLLGRATAAFGQGDPERTPPHQTQDSRSQNVPLPGDPRFLRMFESGIICALVCDLVGNIKDANDAFLAMVGYTREELTSGQLRWVEMTPPEWRHLDDDAVEQLKAGGVTRTWEKEYFRKDGSRVPILVGVAMLNDAECIAFVLDITERKRLEQLRTRALELETQNRRIQEANRLKSEFLANMSHELRTPLNSIIGFADLLYDREVTPDSPKHQEFLGDIVKSSRHLLQIINDVLDLAKVEAGKIDLRPERIDVAQVAAETSAVLRSAAAAKEIKLRFEIDPAVRWVTVDPARLKQVLYNYASNALKFTAEGGEVVIRTRPEGDQHFRLEVQDNGIGIAAHDRSRLFVEFQQLDAGTAKRHQGTGLGLALTKRLVEAQGGAVGFDSTLGKGSVFYAVLPREAPLAELEEEEPAPLPGDESGAVILVVEDDPRDRRLLLQILRRAGYGSEAVSNGIEAITTCQQRTFDAITLDLLLPDITGLEVLHSLRSEGRNLNTPVLVVSVVAERGIVGGYAVHDYLRKPIDSATLLTSLRRAGVAPGRNDGILVVDDDPAALKLMEATLSRLGYRADCHLDASSALSGLGERRPAAVILDLLMPEVDGFEFLARFRQQRENQDIPVIVWTMKDLTAVDLAKLHRLAQAVIAKGDSQAPHLIDQLRRLLQPQAGAIEAHP
jgi:PAS domain S-box-containing protein